MVQRGLFGGQFQLITQDDAKKIHMATLEILESTGMHCPSRKIIGVFEDGGAEVDPNGKRVRIPQHLVDEALRKVPHEVVFCGRDSANDLLLEAGRVYYGMGGTPVPFIRDLHSVGPFLGCEIGGEVEFYIVGGTKASTGNSANFVLGAPAPFSFGLGALGLSVINLVILLAVAVRVFRKTVKL